MDQQKITLLDLSLDLSKNEHVIAKRDQIKDIVVTYDDNGIVRRVTVPFTIKSELTTYR